MTFPFSPGLSSALRPKLKAQHRAAVVQLVLRRLGRRKEDTDILGTG